ncbi:hypothetical protein D0C36_22360 [Mucilaginibacter conchicola]|uniref:Uncharacterized protein n=1 Tax=Mucilaginibacter conchicola TaxID=2303333 RepID=A0A372NQ75_9SPHI|nr:hypothetical protein [Mucilaginibacter conchicola]RFZ90525.1 hypothetical protein D0C36_22360 [Mucilaginibacter conchicola]
MNNKCALLLCLLMLSVITGYAQSKRHNADYYFHSAAKYLVSPGDAVTDSIIKSNIALYTKAIQLDHKFYQAYRNRSREYYQLKLYDKAIADLISAIRYAKPKEKWYLYEMRADIYYEINNFKAAVYDLGFVISVDGNVARAYLKRAKAYWQLNLKDKACNDYSKAFKMDPSVADNKEFLICY